MRVFCVLRAPTYCCIAACPGGEYGEAIEFLCVVDCCTFLSRSHAHTHMHTHIEQCDMQYWCASHWRFRFEVVFVLLAWSLKLSQFAHEIYSVKLTKTCPESEMQYIILWKCILHPPPVYFATGIAAAPATPSSISLSVLRSPLSTLARFFWL